ncbi:MAG: HAMP domain-containing histidine kinase [Deltaproteobacteria bacterium]|nr:HAMP domain-containing histidine kinase [Deltaproteobacteria bacterium]
MSLSSYLAQFSEGDRRRFEVAKNLINVVYVSTASLALGPGDFLWVLHFLPIARGVLVFPGRVERLGTAFLFGIVSGGVEVWTSGEASAFLVPLILLLVPTILMDVFFRFFEARLREEQEWRTKLERSNEVSRRLESVGSLASGIAHEINTPLQFVDTSLTFVEESVEEVLRVQKKYLELQALVGRNNGEEPRVEEAGSGEAGVTERSPNGQSGSTSSLPSGTRLASQNSLSSFGEEVATSPARVGGSSTDSLSLPRVFNPESSFSPTGDVQDRRLRDGLVEIGNLEGALDIRFLVGQIPVAIGRAREGLGRVVKVVEEMERISRSSATEKNPGDVNRMVEAAVTMAQSRWSDVAKVYLELEDVPAIACYEAELVQTFLNLILNAADAIRVRWGTDEGGIIAIHTSLVEEKVEVFLTDNGCGISKELLSRVFDPFFTSKEGEFGAGNGLAIAQAAVCRLHGGVMNIESQEGQGSCVQMWLPVEAAEG